MEIDKAMCWIRVQQSNIQYKHTKRKDADFEKYQPFLGWKPLDEIRKTFEATTQWAATTFSTPMKRHYKSRFPTLNHPRLNEMFSHVVWINTSFGGYTCAQLYYGVKSKYIALYPMTTVSRP